eukprot:3226655-Pyramimonas_sp.AAC.1
MVEVELLLVAVMLVRVEELDCVMVDFEVLLDSVVLTVVLLVSVILVREMVLDSVLVDAVALLDSVVVEPVVRDVLLDSVKEDTEMLL